ncbi:MAG TPA: winged helix-turn-helix domain-containing protein [Pyrinomonadaceae bacterium]|nr:winged helix-turn-helix domain-containing protein [Pyrinomonadaceae bacterium]
MSAESRHIYEFGPFRLIPSERQLWRDKAAVSLKPKVFDLLVVLVENSGRLIEKEELMKRIWPDSFVEEANLSVTVSALRRALGEGPEDNRFVETVPRHGYRFVANVKGFSEYSDDHPKPTENEPVASSPSIASPRPLFSRRVWAAALVVLLIGVSIIGLNRLREKIGSNTTAAGVQSLAVLPLENATGDASQDYFASGITDALIAGISKVQVLRVMSRQAVMKYKNSGKSPAEIGRELHLDAVIAGSVTRSGDRVQVLLRMIDGPTGRNLWSSSYDRDMRDVLKLQSDVTRDVADEVGLKIVTQQQDPDASLNVEAYDDYLRGKFYLYRQTREDNEVAIADLEKAVTKDPNFAAAHAALAQAYTWKLFLFVPNEKQLEEKAFVAVEKALTLDPNSAVAYLARGRLLWTPANHFPHDRAIREYRRALELDPTLDEARNQLALVYCHIGALDEALQESKLALTTDPNNNLAQYRIGQTLNFQLKYDEALSVLRAIPQNANPALIGHQTAWALFNLGKREEASAMLEQLLKDHPEDSGGVFTSVQAVLAAAVGQVKLAEDRIKTAVEKGRGFGHFHHTAYHIACAYAIMNKPDEAMKWLEAAAEDGFPCYPLFEKDSNLDNLRQDPRFVGFLAKQKKRWEYYRTIL